MQFLVPSFMMCLSACVRGSVAYIVYQKSLNHQCFSSKGSLNRVIEYMF